MADKEPVKFSMAYREFMSNSAPYRLKKVSLMVFLAVMRQETGQNSAPYACFDSCLGFVMFLWMLEFF
jgi:hypothetical protein